MVNHPLLAAIYDHLLALSEARGLSEHRRQLLSQARGNVLEIGAGTGLNLVHYPPGAVTSVVALEPDGAMRRRLERRVAAGGSPVPCQVIGTDVSGASFPDHAFDTVVCSFVLCTVADPTATVDAIKTWLVPHGTLLFLEHVRATGWAGGLQRVADPFWRWAAAGCHLDRDTLAVLRGADLAVTDCQRFAMPAGGVLLSACVQGTARPRPLVAEVTAS